MAVIDASLLPFLVGRLPPDLDFQSQGGRPRFAPNVLGSPIQEQSQVPAVPALAAQLPPQLPLNTARMRGPVGPLPDFALQTMGQLRQPAPLPVAYPDMAPPPAPPAQIQAAPRQEAPQGSPLSFGQPDAMMGYKPEVQGESQVQTQGGGSNAMLYGLLAAGLGILANNRGNYGAAGPAIGQGGLMGLNTFLGQKQQDIENIRRDQLARTDEEYKRALIESQKGQLSLQQEKALREQEKAIREQQRLDQQAATALALAGNDPVQQRLAVADSENYLKYRIGQLKPDYKERTIKEGTTAHDEYSLDGGKTWDKVPGGGRYDLRAAKGGTDISLKVEGEQGKAFTGPIADEVKASYQRAQDAIKSESAVENLRRSLNNPQLIAGIGANVRLKAGQVAQFFGGEGADLVATREAIQSLAELTLQSRGMLKGQGQVTEYEQKTLEKARSGDIEMTVPELKALANVLSRMNKAQYDAHSSVMRRLGTVPGAEQAIKFFQPDPFPGAPPEDKPGTKDPWE